MKGTGLLARVLGHEADRSDRRSSIGEVQDDDVKKLESLVLHDESGRKSGSSMVEKLEKKAKQVVSIQTELTEENLKKCHAQLQSPLFQLPAELRELVWEAVFSPKEEPSIGYQDAYLEMRRQQKFCLDLSKTCRLAWLETNGIAMRRAEHRFWLDLGDGPKEFLAEFKNAWMVQSARNEREKRARAAAASQLRFAEDFTVNNRRDLQSIRIFATDFWLREKFPPLMPLFLGYTGICPRKLTIAISAYSFQMSMKYDTWNQKQWLAKFLNQPSISKLKQIHLEIESDVHGDGEMTKQLVLGLRVDEIKMLVSKLKGLESRPARLDDGSWRVFVMQEESETRDWDDLYGRLDSARHFGIEARRAHRITIVTWKAVQVEKPESAETPSSWIDACSRKGDAKKDERNRAAKSMLQRWEEEGSLLRFA